MSISLSFDIGHSSIGWAAINIAGKEPKILGSGAVVFPAEDCQNQQRAGFRRQRRHIAATRNRIKRLEAFLQKVGMLKLEDIEHCREAPHPWPWLLAAQVIDHSKQLNARELWSVIRWYAHNRGYDGNALWAGEDSDPDDVKKVQAARKLMESYNTSTMCGTVCALLEVDPKAKKNPELKNYFKGENAAFPRSIIVAEMRNILEAHIGSLEGISQELIEALLCNWKLANQIDFNARLPERYCGGLLFGQLKPRFDNRIIPNCRITGEKTPSKHSREFYRYRWAMLMSNLRVEDRVLGGSRPLNVDEIQQLDKVMITAGFLNKTLLKKTLEKSLKAVPTNLEAMFILPEMEEALTLDPAAREVSSKLLKPIWTTVPDKWKPLFLNQLFNGRNYNGEPASLAQWRGRISSKGDEVEKFDTAVQTAFELEQKVLEKKGLQSSLKDFTKRPIRIATRHIASGRAPYARSKLIEAVDSVMSGKDPRAVGGPLEETEAVRNTERDREIDQMSNNHLVRHRLKIFEKTMEDLVKRYADGDPRKVDTVCVEVVRDLVQFSGKTAKEKAQLLGQQLAHHRKISKYLEEEREVLGGSWAITPSLIKKIRIADDLGWACPYTGKKYSLNQIIHGEVDREHIIPRSKRPTDAMHALVLSFSEINREKGARTGLQFIEDTKDASHTFSPKQYRDFVNKLKKKNGPSKDDESRCTKRKIALLSKDYEPRGTAKANADEPSISSFTEGSLSQTSYLNKLAAQQVKRWFAKHIDGGDNLPKIVQLSGSVTAATRHAWDLFDQLAEACPETRGKIKTDIREITHLHHALDAITIGLSAHYFPEDGYLWALLSKRRITSSLDRDYVRTALRDLISFNSDGRWNLKPLPDSVRSGVADSLSEKRVVRHNPKTMRGLRVQQNVWRVLGEDPDDDSKMLLRMRPRDEEGNKGKPKEKPERKTKLMGIAPKNGAGKLSRLKGAIIVEDNYGVALDPEPKVIAYQQVWKQLSDLRYLNGGKPVRVLRNGDVISIAEGRYEGIWRVHSIKDAKAGLAIDMARPDRIRVESKGVGSKRMVLLSTLLKSGFKIISGNLTGGS